MRQKRIHWDGGERIVRARQLLDESHAVDNDIRLDSIEQSHQGVRIMNFNTANDLSVQNRGQQIQRAWGT